MNWTEINRKTLEGNNPLNFRIKDGVNPEIFEKIFNDSKKYLTIRKNIIK